MRVNVKQLLREVEFVNRFIARKTTIPILSNIKLVASGTRLDLIGTDLEVTGFSHVSGWHAETWAVTVPSKPLLDYLKKVKDQEIELLPNTETHKLALADSAGRVVLDGMSVESYPEMPGLPALAFEWAGLEDSIPRVSMAISLDESRFTLNGALLDLAAGSLVATDGHRLSKTSVTLRPFGHAEQPKRILIPRKALTEACRMNSGRAWVGVDEESISFVTTGRAILTRKLKGNFPDYERVLPKEWAHEIVLDANVLAQTLDRVKLFADKRSGAVVFKTGEGVLHISASTVEGGAGEGEVPAPGAEPGWTTGFNARYISDYLTVAKGKLVAFKYNEPTKAAVFTTAGEDTLCLVMPLRIA